MNRLALAIAGGISLLVVAVLISISTRHKIKTLEQERAELLETNAQQIAELQRWRDAATEQDEIIDALLLESEQAAQTQRSLEDEMRAALQSREVTISELKGKLTVNILDRILFDSGEAVLKPEGEKILQQIAGVLAQHTNRQVHVIGHTDDVPIHRKFASNWELSTARAIAAVRFLQEKAGVDPRRLGALGYGEFHPIASNSTPEGRAKNRRIELVVLPQDLIAPTPTSNAKEAN